MRISDWSSDVCSSDLLFFCTHCPTRHRADLQRVTRLGALLAGGGARRFGRDKALALWAGRPLIAHAADILIQHSDALVVCGRLTSPPAVPHLADRPAPEPGPLGGMCAALCPAADPGHARGRPTGCASPSIDAELLPPP